jgi:hypothetical protein
MDADRARCHGQSISSITSWLYDLYNTPLAAKSLTMNTVGGYWLATFFLRTTEPNTSMCFAWVFTQTASYHEVPLIYLCYYDTPAVLLQVVLMNLYC